MEIIKFFLVIFSIELFNYEVEREREKLFVQITGSRNVTYFKFLNIFKFNLSLWKFSTGLKIKKFRNIFKM